jgi:hypothetical protein
VILLHRDSTVSCHHSGVKNRTKAHKICKIVVRRLVGSKLATCYLHDLDESIEYNTYHLVKVVTFNQGIDNTRPQDHIYICLLPGVIKLQVVNIRRSGLYFVICRLSSQKRRVCYSTFFQTFAVLCRFETG